MPRTKQSYRKARGDGRYTSSTNAPIRPVDFKQQLARLQQMTLSQLKDMVRLAAMPQFVEHQGTVLSAALPRLFGVATAHAAQLRVVRRIVYGVGDTLLIARTGFGKSLTFQAYCALTNKIALQLVPLSKLGEQQAARMTMIRDASAALITAETLEQDHRLLYDVQRCKYNHILLGPEQAVSPRFKSILRDPDFAKRVGLIIIDEVHVLSTWSIFRDSVTYIRELRHILPSRVVMYGCTGTLTRAQEIDVIAYAGFNPASSSVLGLKLIRISVDRPELQICICPILKGKATSYVQLYFILNGAVQDKNNPEWFQRGQVLPPGYLDAARCAMSPHVSCTPQRIPKTIVFIDGTKLIGIAAGYMRLWLQDLGYGVQEAAQVVSTYSSHTSEYDQSAILTEFMKEGSEIRILVATSAVGMGMDITDVDVVLQWNLPRDQELSELWQRWGRAARGLGRSGLVVLFAPHYCFDWLGRVAPRNPVLAAAFPNRAMLPRTQQPAQDSAAAPSRLRESQTIGSDGGETLSGSDCSSHAVDSDNSAVPAGVGQQMEAALPPWSAQDIAARGRVQPIILEVCNSTCHRRIIMRELQDHLSEPDSRQAPAVGVHCCSGSSCGPQLLVAAQSWAIAPDAKVSVLKRPKAKSTAGKALLCLENWVQLRAAEYSERVGLWCAAPTAAVMSMQARISIACSLGRARHCSGLPAPLRDTASFLALHAVAAWAAEMRVMARWRPDLDIEGLIEQLRLDAAEWPVFNWRATGLQEGGPPVELVRTDVAQKEARLAAEQRVQQEKEAELEAAMLDLHTRGAAAGLLQRVRQLTTNLEESRARAENTEFVLAAAHGIQERIQEGSSQGYSQQLRSDGATALLSSSSTSAATTADRGDIASVAIDAGSPWLDASEYAVAATQYTPTEGAAATGPLSIPSSNIVVTESFSGSSAVDSQPGVPTGLHTPTATAGCMKQGSQVPGSGRKGWKRKIRRTSQWQGEEGDNIVDGNAIMSDGSAASIDSSPSRSRRVVGERRSARPRKPSRRVVESREGLN